MHHCWCAFFLSSSLDAERRNNTFRTGSDASNRGGGWICSVEQMDGMAGGIGDVRYARSQPTNLNKRRIRGDGKREIGKLFKRVMA